MTRYELVEQSTLLSTVCNGSDPKLRKSKVKQSIMNKKFLVYFFSIPYSGREIFANYRLFAKILSANVLFFVDKDRAIALIRENEMLYLAHSQKFSPAKIFRPLYGILIVSQTLF